MNKELSALTALRVSLGVVFLWFGALKIVGMSPVASLVQAIYPALPYPGTIIAIGVIEVVIGLGFISNKMLKATIWLMWLQMVGIFGGLIIAPQIFFADSNPLLLTIDGEFVIKNLVLLAASVLLYIHQD